MQSVMCIAAVSCSVCKCLWLKNLNIFREIISNFCENISSVDNKIENQNIWIESRCKSLIKAELYLPQNNIVSSHFIAEEACYVSSEIKHLYLYFKLLLKVHWAAHVYLVYIVSIRQCWIYELLWECAEVTSFQPHYSR